MTATFKKFLNTAFDFTKRVLVYGSIFSFIFIACAIDSLNLINVICAMGVIIAVWKLLGLTETFKKEFESDID